jgi:predicted transport protein
MRFADISDPRSVCRDVSGLGRWGNGDVEFRMSKHDEMPYAIGLVRQSLERQLGDED